MKVLKNAPFDKPASIVIKGSDPGWEEAYTNWINNENPTNSPEWKKGVFLGYMDELKGETK